MNTKSLETLVAEHKAKSTKKDDLLKEIADLDCQIKARKKEDRKALATAIGYAMIRRHAEPKIRQILDELPADKEFKPTKLLEELLNPPKSEQTEPA